MSKHSEKAFQLFTDKHNCCQSVFCAFCDKTGLEMSKAVQIAAGMGGGVGRSREVCGAVTGMIMAYGAMEGFENATQQEKKKHNEDIAAKLVREFRRRNGTILCREFLNGAPSGHIDICFKCISSGAELLDEYLEKGEELFKDDPY